MHELPGCYADDGAGQSRKSVEIVSLRLAKGRATATLRCPMSAPQALEPAVRDPKKLRRTAWILVAVMVVGGFSILTAYNKWIAPKLNDDRPAIIHRIQPDRTLRVGLQDRSRADLLDLRDKVVALHVVHLDQPEDSARSEAVVGRLAETYAGEDDFRIVTLVLNPGQPAELFDRLASAATKLNAKLPRWWVASTEQATLVKFIRKELKPSVPPEKLEAGWRFDPGIVLLDRNGHIRRAVVPQKVGGKPYIAPFDFDQAADWDEQGIKTGTELSNQQQLEVLLHGTIDKLLLETLEQKSSLRGLIGTLIAVLLVCFLVFLRVFRSKSNSASAR